MLWISGITFLLLRKLCGRTKKGGDWAKLVGYALLVAAIACLAFAPLPFVFGNIATYAADLAGWVAGWVAGWFDVSVATAAGVALVLMLLFTAFDLKDKKPDGMAKTTAFALPVLALLAAGPVAPRVLEFFHAVNDIGPQLVAALS